MNRRKVSWTTVVVVLVAGCVPALNPIYTEDDVIFEKALLGTWRDVDSKNAKVSMVFTQDEDKAYRVVSTDEDGKKGTFSARLAKIQDTMFLDLQPVVEEFLTGDFHKGHLIRAHSFYLVEKIEPDLHVRDLDYLWLKKHLDENPNAIAHEKPDDQIVITASTQKLQQFVLKHVKTEGAFSEPSVLKRD